MTSTFGQTNQQAGRQAGMEGAEMATSHRWQTLELPIHAHTTIAQMRIDRTWPTKQNKNKTKTKRKQTTRNESKRNALVDWGSIR